MGCPGVHATINDGYLGGRETGKSHKNATAHFFLRAKNKKATCARWGPSSSS